MPHHEDSALSATEAGPARPRPGSQCWRWNRFLRPHLFDVRHNRRPLHRLEADVGLIQDLDDRIGDFIRALFKRTNNALGSLGDLDPYLLRQGFPLLRRIDPFNLLFGRPRSGPDRRAERVVNVPCEIREPIV